MTQRWMYSWLENVSTALARPRVRQTRNRTVRPRLEILEGRLAPATHTWVGLGASSAWSDPKNWDIGAPAYNEPNIILNYPTAHSGFTVSEDDLSGLVIDAIVFNGSGYVIAAPVPGTAININQGINALAGSNTFDASLTGISFTGGGYFDLGTDNPGTTAEIIINSQINNGQPIGVYGTGGSVLQLNGDNVSSTGGFTLGGGLTLEIGNDSALGSGTLVFNDLSGKSALEPVNGARTLANPIVLTTQGTITGDVAGDGMILNGPITGPGLLTVGSFPGGFGVVLNGVNSYTGGTTVYGPVGINNNNAFGTGTVEFADSESPDQLVGLTDGITLTNDLFIDSMLSLPENGALNLNGQIGAFDGSGLEVDGGTVALNGVNTTLTAAITVTAGTLAVGNNNALGTGALVMQGGTILDAVGAPVVLSNPIQLGGTVTTQGVSLTLTGNISGSGSLTVDSPGASLYLSGVNSYQGTTLVQAGELVTKSATALPGATALTIAQNASIGLQSDMTVGSLSGAGPIYFEDAFAVTTGADNTNTTYSGSITNLEGLGFKTSLTKVGTGVFTFSGTTGYSGPTTVASGTLQLDGTIGGQVIVQSTGRVTGIGTAGILDIFGIAQPGDGGQPGTLQVTGVTTFEPNSTLGVTISGNALGTGYAQFAGATVNLAGNAILAPNLTYSPAVGSTFTIVSASVLNGPFFGLPDGTTFVTRNTYFAIHYTATSAVLTVIPGPPTKITVSSGDRQSTPFGTGFASPLVLTVTDAAGHAVPGVTVTFTTPSAGPGSVLQSNTRVTTDSGQVSELVTANGMAGNYQVSATVAGVAMPAAFQLTNLSGSIGGTLFQDINDNGTQEPAEPGLGGQELFLDLNGSGALQPGDPTTTTDANGNYQFTITSAGTYTVRPILPGGVLIGAPANQDYADSFTTGTNVTGQNFAEVPTSIAVPLTLPPATPFPKQGNANADFVEAVYRSVLDRNADPGGLANWTKVLNSGSLSRLQVVQGIRQAPEHLNQEVTDFYFTILNRAPDAQGLKNWVQALQSGKMTEEQVAFTFLDSAEYLSKGDKYFVDHMYLSILGRPFDAAGEANWLSALGDDTSGKATHPATATHEQIITNFLYSAESLNRLVQGFYQIYLQRLADPSGLKTWLTRLQQGGSFLTIGQQFLSSDEFYNRAAAQK